MRELILPFFVGATLSMAANTVSAQPAPEAPLLPPGSPWQMDYAENECRLIREFGEGDNLIVLRLATAGSGTFDFVLAGPGIPDLPLRRSTRLTLTPQHVEVDSDGYSMQVPEQHYHFLRLFDVDSAFLGQLQPGQVVTVNNGSFTARLRLDNVVRALAAMQQCVDDLQTRWGVDVARVKSFVRQPAPVDDPGRWITTDDYPVSALAAGQSGDVMMLATIGTDGRVAECRVVVSSQVEALDRASCEVFSRRARFSPALGPDGQPIESPYLRRVRWQISNY
jgi:TonB family protein